MPNFRYCVLSARFEVIKHRTFNYKYFGFYLHSHFQPSKCYVNALSIVRQRHCLNMTLKFRWSIFVCFIYKRAKKANREGGRAVLRNGRLTRNRVNILCLANERLEKKICNFKWFYFSRLRRKIYTEKVTWNITTKTF